METTYALNENETLQEIKRPPRIGFIKTFAGTTPPEGTLLCDGSAVSRDTYYELFAAIGTTWGAGDGANTFNLPDLRDVWILCAGTEHEAGDSVAEGLPNITGGLAVNNNTYESGKGRLLGHTGGASGAFSNSYDTQNEGSGFQKVTSPVIPAGVPHIDAFMFYASLSNSIYGASTHVTPASVAVLPCIVYE